MFSDLRLATPELVREILTAVGAEWEDQPEGVALVMLPGQPELRRITFESEVAREDSQAELAIQGSRFLEDLVSLAYSRGRLAQAFANPFLRPPSGLQHAYRLVAEHVTRTEWEDRVWTTWAFAFGISLVGEFRRDEMFFCAVDAVSLRLIRRFEQSFSQLSLAPTGPAPSWDRPFEECYAVAREEAARKATALWRSAQRETDRSLQNEMVHLKRYYDGLLQEVSRDLERLNPSDPRRTSILARAEATRLDRERMAAQVQERHRLSLKVEAMGAVGMVYPRQVATLILSDKGSRSVRVEATWDPILEQFEPFLCPSCRKPTYGLECRDGVATCGCIGGKGTV